MSFEHCTYSSLEVLMFLSVKVSQTRIKYTLRLQISVSCTPLHSNEPKNRVEA